MQESEEIVGFLVKKANEHAADSGTLARRRL
jgi:hypothetical protein